MNAAIVIGVDKVSGGLPNLRAAASGALEVADWLKRNEYVVDLFTDQGGSVERAEIFQAALAIVEAGTAKKLLIYLDVCRMSAGTVV